MCAGPRLRGKLKKFFDTNVYMAVNLTLTLYVLFANDILRAFLPKSFDTGVQSSLFACFALFLTDNILHVCLDRKYVFTFFWWIDMVWSPSSLLLPHETGLLGPLLALLPPSSFFSHFLLFFLFLLRRQVFQFY